MSTREVARVSTYVAVSPRDAFDVFTSEVDLWWRRGPRFRGGGAASALRFEQDGDAFRLVEEGADGRFEIGRVQIWEPGTRLVMSYRLRSFAPGEQTELEVRFEPEGRGTRVTLEHRGWENIGSDHPARRGLSGEAFTSMIGLEWGDLVTSYRVRAQARLSASHRPPRGD